ncbi:hypothetical protein QBC32DRAFT_367031 [Pseudoneurospora amorphoporcata]|uniref:2EXR domain-containing protein n=1 Tax=Pseudoneurospora amorphoporcata TaxID=241081 RepID=A0AAN6SK34_9PEZI|nr:hypothetical protein QBC32DRAFT_367031 [Pseudoneurospora amorphoporcata]
MAPPLTTFHPFPRLPWELRNEIWKFSIRPLDLPGAHVFCVEGRDLEDTEYKDCDVHCARIPLEPQPWKSDDHTDDTFLHMAVPAKTLSSDPTGNPSLYLVDGGLWTACKESRAAMERAFRHQMWDTKRRAYPHYRSFPSTRPRIYIAPSLVPIEPFPSRSPSPQRPPYPYRGFESQTHLVPATGFFLSASLPASSSSDQEGTGEADQAISESKTFPHYFTVLPHQDLFIILPSPRVSNSDDAYWQKLELGFPLWSPKMGFYGFNGRNGLAIEFDPNWSQESKTHVRDMIYDAVIHFADAMRIQTIWLIDYRLKPNDDIPAEKREPTINQKVWYGGDGCLFVEMYSRFLEDGGEHLEWYYTEGIAGENSSIAEGSCHAFIENFEWYHFDLYERESSGSDNFFSRFPPYVGILACLR